MPPTVDEQISKLNQTIAEMESQRPVLGGEVVDAALVPLYQKLADLLTQVDRSSDVQNDMPERQRKMVTLLFMDVVGSTKMTQHLDPEDTMDIMDSALDHLAVPVDSHGGKVTRFMGDGFMALFGDPVASEDDPEQAIRAGLKILEIAQALAHELEKEWGIEEFQIRVGVNTGLTVLGGLTEAENTVMGLPVNLAARLESAAPPGGLLISHDTYRHVRGVFEVEPQEPIAAKGFPEPVPVYLVKSSRPRAFRVLSRGVEGIETRMVGRDPELKILQDALYAMNEDNEGQVVTVLGEAGVGKSRLLYEFQNWMELLQGEISRYQGRAHHDTQSHPFSLLREVFTFRFQIRDNDPSKSVCQKIETGFCEALGTNKEGKMRAHFIGQLLGFDFSSSPYLKEVANDAQQLRNRGLRYLCDYFQTVSDVIPSIIFLEDIHWSDDSSLDAINKLGQLTPKHPLIIVCLARSTLLERRPYWGEGLEYHRLLELRPLTKRESRLLVSEILKLVDQVPPALRELVVSGAEGNPFYIEELIKMLIEEDVILKGEDRWRVEQARLESVEVPATLTGVLQARLESLPKDEKVVLQQASVIGRVFWDKTLEFIHSSSNNAEKVSSQLDSLRGKELVYRREESAFGGAREHIFKHAILRDVTYQSVLKRLRATYHGLAADWLIAHSSQRTGEYAGLIAEHLEAAGRTEQAISYLNHAGQLAAARYANEEAVQSYQRALKLLESLPNSDVGDMLKSKLVIEIKDRLGDIYSLIGQINAARTTYQSALSEYPDMDLYFRVRLQRKIGNTLREQREYENALQSYTQAEALFQKDLNLDEEELRQEWISIQFDRLVIYYFMAEWAKMTEIVEITQPVVDKYGSAFQRSIHLSNVLRMQMRRDRYTISEETKAIGQEMLNLSLEDGNPKIIAESLFSLGFLYLWQGKFDASEKSLLESLEISERIGDVVTQIRCLTYLSILYRRQCRQEDTENYVNQCLELARPTGMNEYIGTAQANLSWVRLRQGNLEASEALSMEAFELWSQMPLNYPFQWTAILPLIEVSITKIDIQEIQMYANKLLDASQLRLPDAVEKGLKESLAAIDEGNNDLARSNLEDTLILCQKFNFL